MAKGVDAAARPERPASLCAAELVLPVRPRDVNVLSTVFGGYVMELVDRVATLAASRFASRPVVTASLDRLDFLAGLRAYQLIRLRAHGTRSFRTSMEVRVGVEGEDPITGRRWPTAQALLTLVALGDDGRPTPFPLLVPETDAERAEWEAAARHRDLRLTVPAEPTPDFYATGPQTTHHLSLELSTEPVMPENVNELGFATAGWLFSASDKLAGIVAARHGKRPAVTASVESVSFRQPIRLGEVTTCKAFVTRAFNTSMEVRVEVWKRFPFGAEPEYVSTSYSTFVALGEDGRPAAVPAVEPRDAFERQLYTSAGERRALRPPRGS